jgi:lipopolysaccharide transport system permease protein
MVGVIEGFRWSLLGTAAPDWQMMAISFCAMSVLLVAGLAYFRKVETSFADII